MDGTTGDAAALLRFFEDGIPFNAWLGMRVERFERSPGSGRVAVRVPFRPELVGDIRRPALHGGVLSALADTAGGLAVFAGVDDPLQSRISTVDLLVDYLRPGKLEDLVCEAEVLRMGNRVAVAQMVVRQGDHVPAQARGVYNVVRATDP
ncbi:MAG: hotdog fold thioesterase [Myxococcota bacterium]